MGDITCSWGSGSSHYDLCTTVTGKNKQMDKCIRTRGHPTISLCLYCIKDFLGEKADFNAKENVLIDDKVFVLIKCPI